MPSSTKQSAYSPVPNSHDFDDSRTLNGDSGSDAGDSLIGHRRKEKNWDEEEVNSRKRCQRWCLSPLVQGVANIILAILVVALLLERHAPVSTNTTTTTKPAAEMTAAKELEGSGDVTGFIPPVGQKITTFVPNMSFVPENGSDFFTHEVQQMWLSTVPPGLGYLRVKEPEKYKDLPHPLVGYKGTVFTTSVTHQLHCLYNIVEVYSSLISGHPIEKQMQGHLPHCFEYLRQSIMCCGDTALEGQHTTFPDGILGSDGWDAKHVCKDYSAIYDYLKEHRADNAIWI